MNDIHLKLTDSQVQQLREVIDALPLSTHATLILAVTEALPMTHDFSLPRDTRSITVMLDNLLAVRS